MQQKSRETVQLFNKQTVIKNFKVVKTKAIQTLLVNVEKPKLFSINGKYFSYDLLIFFWGQKLIRYQQANTFSVLDICLSLNFIVPHFCYHFNLSIAGNCRMCLVEIAPSAKPIVSCGFNLGANQLILTDSLVVKRARAFIMEFLLVNHPLDCPVCDQGGECDLQDQSLIYGNDRGRFYHPSEFKRAISDIICTPMINFTLTRCIHCTRCTRFLAEIGGEKALGMLGRGFFSEIGTYDTDISLTSELSSNITDFCPVGALTGKSYALSYRNWDDLYLESIDLSDSSCASIRVYSNLNKITRLLPQYNTTLEVNWIHDKTRHLIDGLNLQRINYPMSHEDRFIFSEDKPFPVSNVFLFVFNRLKTRFNYHQVLLIKKVRQILTTHLPISKNFSRAFVTARLNQAIFKRLNPSFTIHSESDRSRLTIEESRNLTQERMAYGNRSLTDVEITEEIRGIKRRAEAEKAEAEKAKAEKAKAEKAKKAKVGKAEKVRANPLDVLKSLLEKNAREGKKQHIQSVEDEGLTYLKALVFKKFVKRAKWIKFFFRYIKESLELSSCPIIPTKKNVPIDVNIEDRVEFAQFKVKFPSDLAAQQKMLRTMFYLRYEDFMDPLTSQVDYIGLLKNTQEINELMFEVLTEMELIVVFTGCCKNFFMDESKNVEAQVDKSELLNLGERSVRNFIQISWRNLSKMLLISLNNFTVHRKIKTFTGNFLDLVTLLQLKECSLILGNNNLYNFSETLLFNSSALINDDFDFNYIYNSTDISKFKNFFLINLNLRFKNPVLNAKIRQKKLWTRLTKIFYLGPKYNLTYKYQHLGTTTKILLKIIEGRYYLVNFLSNPKAKRSTLLLYGSDLCNTYKNGFYRSFFNALKVINKFMSVNYLAHNVSSISSFDLSLGKCITQTSRFPIAREITTAPINYYLGCNYYLTRFKMMQSFFKNQLFIYQASSFDKYYNFVDIFLPNMSYYETKHEFYVNCYGLLKRTRRILLPSESGAKESDEIIHLVYNIIVRLTMRLKSENKLLPRVSKNICDRSSTIYLRIFKKFLNKYNSGESSCSSFSSKKLYIYFSYRLETKENLTCEFLFSYYRRFFFVEQMSDPKFLNLIFFEMGICGLKRMLTLQDVKLHSKRWSEQVKNVSLHLFAVTLSIGSLWNNIFCVLENPRFISLQKFNCISILFNIVEGGKRTPLALSLYPQVLTQIRIGSLYQLNKFNVFRPIHSYYLREYKFVFAEWKFRREISTLKFVECSLFKVLNKEQTNYSSIRLETKFSGVDLLVVLYIKKLTQIYTSLKVKSYYSEIASVLLFLKKTCHEAFCLELARLYKFNKILFKIFVSFKVQSPFCHVLTKFNEGPFLNRLVSKSSTDFPANYKYNEFFKKIHSIYSYIPIYLYEKRIFNMYFNELEIYYSLVYFYLFTSRDRNFFKTSLVTYYSRNMSNLSTHFFKKKSTYTL